MGDEWVSSSFSDQGMIDEGGVRIHLDTMGDESFDPQAPFGGITPPHSIPPPKSFPEEKDVGEVGFDVDGLKEQLASQIAGSVLSGQILKDTSQQAKSFFDLNSHIDWVRPHFDVSPNDIFNRLIGSIAPTLRTDFGEGNADLYGPSMIVFTLISIFVFIMKEEASKSQQNDGLIMGTAFGLSFTYWWVSSLWYYTLVFATGISVSFLHVLSAAGYAMVGYCIALLPQLLLLPEELTKFFFIILGLLSGSSLACLFFFKAGGSLVEGGKGLLVAGLVFATHMTFLLYLYFFFVKGSSTHISFFWEGLV
uniref:Protein YIPF3 n=1 Tax=Paramoeba aestuarina TaxID=180227 RepID=A0A7S4KI94_9EUKA|mmetsp:Transcript_19249/g.30145  ORF Transcript_19249/g.30145 Transcript_19249/m.30145 type:complete len:308 (+) Transcript_19249:81-1004(+)